MKRLQTLGVVLAIAVAAACSEGSGNPEEEPDANVPGIDAGTADAGPDAGESKTLTSIVATPSSAALLVGGTQQIEVNGSYSDGTSAVLSDGLAFASSADTVATVSGVGLVSGTGGGDAVITVTVGTFTDTVDINVTAGIVKDVFTDDFTAGLAYAPFGGSVGQPVVDSTTAHGGSASLKVTIPVSNYTGGALVSSEAVDLTGYTAVTFWAKADAAVILDKVGLGNDVASTVHQAEWPTINLTTSWQRFVFPVPASGILTAEKGLFYFAEGQVSQGATTIWFDDIRYESEPTGGLGTLSPAIATEAVNKLVGDTFPVAGTSLAWDLPANAKVIALAPGHFTFTSSDPLVATVSELGVVTALTVGTTKITAKLGSLDAVGEVSLTVAAASVPTEPNPPPTVPAADVISLFSEAYTNVTVNTWRTEWSGANLTETMVGTDPVKKYTNLQFVGIEFVGANSIDATGMTHFHVDVWTPDSTTFAVRLVDFGANNTYNGPGTDDSEGTVTFTATSTPILVTGQWLSLDIPIADFTGLTSVTHLNQLLFLGSNSTAYIDNVYFHK